MPWVRATSSSMTMPHTDLARMPPTNWALAVATVANVVPYAMLAPLVVVRLTEAGVSATAVGLYGRLVERLGPIRAHRLGLVVATMALGGTAVLLATDPVAAVPLYALASVLGLGTALVWPATEALLGTTAPAARIGRVMGLYQTALGAALAAGPVLAWILPDVRAAAWATAGLLAFAWACALAAKSGASGSDDETELTAARRTPPKGAAAPVLVALALLAALGGAFELGLNAVLPAHALGLGLGGAAPAVVAILAAGGLVVQMPLGWAADRMSARRLARTCIAVLLLGAALLAGATMQTALIWPAAFALGAAGGGLYTLAIIDLGRRASPTALPRLTARIVTAYTAGAVIGPMLSGGALDLGDGKGLAVLVGVLALAALIILPKLSKETEP